METQATRSKEERNKIHANDLPKLYVVGSIPTTFSKALKENSFWLRKFVGES